MGGMMARNIVALLAGILFGLGLAVSEMINPLKVKAFLDFAGKWDPSLILVMMSAIGVTFISFHFILRSPRPRLDTQFHLPEDKSIDLRLLGGAATFGIGWGLAGFCPGPAVSAMVFGNYETASFIIAMLAGIILTQIYENTRQLRQST